MEKNIGAVMVVGAGIGGIQASLDLAELGLKVYLIDKSSNIGGTLSQLDKQFTTNDCGMCQMLPIFKREEASEFCLRRDLTHPNIQIMTNTEVEKIEGSVGDFKVSLQKKARHIKEDKCIGCGLCTEICPIKVKDEFNEGLASRKAIYIKYPQAIPNLYTIDIEYCNRCGECVKVCPTNAIDLSQKDEILELEVGAIILSLGFEEFDSHDLSQYGYGKCLNVVTSTELERMFSEMGPYNGKFIRPSDGKIPRKIAFLQCIGSRDKEKDYCSSACCMIALKEAMLIKKIDPTIDVQIFFMDIRTFGKGYYRYYEKAKEKGIKFVRYRVPAIEEFPDTKNLKIIYETEKGDYVKDEFNLVVLSVGQSPPDKAKNISEILGLKLNKYGFCKTIDFSNVVAKEGIYTCGSFSGPKNISETVTEASAGALKASMAMLSSRGKFSGEGNYPQEIDVTNEDPKIGIFICHCGQEISSIINIKKVKEFASKLSNVCLVEDFKYLCFKPDLNEAKEKIVDSKVNRVIFAACTSYKYEVLFKQSLRQVGFNPSLLQIVNFREQLSWVHKDKKLATEKAEEFLSMAVEKAVLQQPLPLITDSVIKRALVVGAGLSGMTAALYVAEEGFEVDLIERTSELGGNAREIYMTLEGLNVQDFLKKRIEEIENNSLIHIYKNTELEEVTGYAGNFQARLIVNQSESKVISYGAIIVATGAKENQSLKEYSYGEDKRIITQKEMERLIANKEIDVNSQNSIVMIQCVGSREEPHLYCSRVCCSQAIKNALKIKEENPKANIYILYRDIMTYEFKEEYYTKAREMGIAFIRYNVDNKPQLKIEGGKLKVRVTDFVLNEELVINPDFVVLSVGMIPEDNHSLAKILEVTLDNNGFFEEANVKFRPVEFLRDGIFVCGLAHSPRSVKESVTQATAAATKTVILLFPERMLSRRCIAEVNERWCSGCEVCISSCPYKARVIDEQKKVAKVISTLCRGCGTCAAVCPNGAAKLKGYEDKQILSVIDAAI